MSRKNSNVPKKTHKFLFNKLKDKKISQIYNQFEKNFELKEDFIVAVSGGPDSLALSFLTKIYSIKNSLNIKYFIVDHKLRQNSLNETIFVKNLLKKFSIKISILNWLGKKPKSNIQSIARTKRYNLLIKEAKKLKVKNILLGHHKDDLYENFFIRIVRGSGLKGLVSFDKKSQIDKINLVRPLLEFGKEDLIYLSKKIFQTYVEDPSNKDDKFKRVKIRNFIKNLQLEGLDFNKFNLTIKNLKLADNSIDFFIDENIKNNSTFLNNSKSIILNNEFFNYPEEVKFRSFSKIIKIIGRKYYSTRGKKIDKVLELINNKSTFKTTLGNCIIKKVNQSIIVTKEQ